MWKKQILARKKIGRNHAFFRDIRAFKNLEKNAIHSLYFKAFFGIMVA